MITANENTGLDFHLRALGFKDRKYLQLISHDDKTFFAGQIAAKPDWVVYDRATNTVHVIDYKTRIPGRNGVTPYEAYQVIIFGMVMRAHFKKKHGRDVKIETGILFANDAKYEIEPSPEDVRKITASVPKAVDAYKRRGEMNGQYLAASKLAAYMDDPSLSRVVDIAKAKRGTKAHDTLKKVSNL